MPFELLLSFVMQLLSMSPGEKRTITDNFHENRFGYSLSKGFFSCMAFSIKEVVCIACQSHSWFVLCTLMGHKQANHMKDKPLEQRCKRKKPCKRETSPHRVRFGGPIAE